MKKKIILSLIIIVSISLGILIGSTFNKEETSFDDDTSSSNHIVNENTLSMMIERTAGAGDYKMETRTSWPTDGYMFNATLSKCENGGELGWDSEKGVVTMTGNMSDKCYVYFDKVLTLASYVKSLYTGTQGENSIYYHDSSLTNGARDNSYRYAGTSDSVNNYVCINSTETTCSDANLFRIIGVFGDQVKLIKSTSIGSMAWDSNDSNTWSTSSLNTYLNGTYLKSLGDFAEKIATTTWKVGGVSTSEVTAATMYTKEMTSTASGKDGLTVYSSRIALMYAHDYGFAASPTAWSKNIYDYNKSDTAGTAIKTIDWLYLGSLEWLVSRVSSWTDYSLGVGSDGYVYCNYYSDVTQSHAVRPVFYLVSSATYSSGDGTSGNPYRLG